MERNNFECAKIVNPQLALIVIATLVRIFIAFFIYRILVIETMKKTYINMLGHYKYQLNQIKIVGEKVHFLRNAISRLICATLGAGFL